MSSKVPTFEHPALEALANALFKGDERRFLLKDKTPFPISPQYLAIWKGVLAEKELEVENLRLIIAFSEIAIAVCPDGVKIDYHDE